jgi:hypothetical protein
VNIGLATVAARPGATARMPELLRLGADNALEKAKGNRTAKRDAAAAAAGNWSATGKP